MVSSLLSQLLHFNLIYTSLNFRNAFIQLKDSIQPSLISHIYVYIYTYIYQFKAKIVYTICNIRIFMKAAESNQLFEMRYTMTDVITL